MAICTVIKTGAAAELTPSEKVEELKTLIDSIKVPTLGKAGDAVLYDNVKNTMVVINPSKISTTTYPADRYTPVGVIVVPGSHDVYGTGEAAMISLKYMNYSTPDEGSTSLQDICWGEYNTDTALSNLNMAPYTGTCANPGDGTVTGETNYPYLPSDILTGTVCPTDPKANYYNTTSSSYYSAPSPYLEDESRNPAYYQTTSPSSTANALADFDGVGNTEYLLTLATGQSDWKTATTITNNSGAGYAPAACCCWRYSTAGTNQGDWYLPAMGELGYLMPRLGLINETISTLINAYGSSIGSTISTSGWFWASSEYSASIARALYTSSGRVDDDYKDDDNGYVRSFCRV